MPDILYEDNHVLVVVKPPNMLSQADETGDSDILSELKHYLKDTYHKPGNVYLGLVHRLDRPVGGLMVFARTGKAAGRLSAQMREHEMGREYLCIVTGEVEDHFTLTDYLILDEIKNRMVCCDADTKGGKLAILHGRCIARREGTALCAIKLETGRKHQIRAQLSNIGAPLWGDRRYGKGMAGQQIALWGYKLSFEHPVSHKLMTFHAMPEGGIWQIYQDLLTVPEDTEEPEAPNMIHLSDEALETLSRFNHRPGDACVLLDETEETETVPDKKQTIEAKSEIKDEAAPETKAEVQPEMKAEAKPEMKAEAKLETKAEAKPETKDEVKPETKDEVKPEEEPQTEVQAEENAQQETKTDK